MSSSPAPSILLLGKEAEGGKRERPGNTRVCTKKLRECIHTGSTCLERKILSGGEEKGGGKKRDPTMISGLTGEEDSEGEGKLLKPNLGEHE